MSDDTRRRSSSCRRCSRRYLDGELTADERAEVDARLADVGRVARRARRGRARARDAVRAAPGDASARRFLGRGASRTWKRPTTTPASAVDDGAAVVADRVAPRPDVAAGWIAGAAAVAAG